MDRRRGSAPTLFGRQLVMAVDTLFFGSTYSHWLLLAVFFASLSLTAAHGVRLVRRRRLWPRWCDRLCCLIAIFVASVLSVDVFEASYMRTSNAQHILVSILAVAAAVAVSALHLRRSPRVVGMAALPKFSPACCCWPVRGGRLLVGPAFDRRDAAEQGHRDCF